MRNLKLKQIKSIYIKTKKYAQKELNNSNYEKSLKYIETAAQIANMFNWIYTDEELENNLSHLSEKILGSIKRTFTPVCGRVVFYDVFALDNRGLTQQYLRALISWDVEILFVFDGSDLSHSKKIIEEIKAYPKAEFFTVASNLSRTERIKILYEKISDFRPEKAFLHLLPSSVVAVTLWNSLKEVTRYQVNLTDHAFWLGISCIDYSLEFRDYGCAVSYERRNLPQNKLLIQPFYPILDCMPFIGLPEEISIDAIKIFTGGSYYKMYGKSDMFFKLLKTLFELNPKVVLLVAGNGDDEPIRKFVNDNNFQERLFFLGSRPDITYVFENCDIYLCTYPISGLLMGQYAAKLGKPILSYSSEDMPCNFSEGFINFNASSDFKITHTTIDTFKADAIKMIENKSYREALGLQNIKHIISEKEFSEHLKKLVTNNKMESPFHMEIINYEVFCDLYIENENKYLRQFNYFIVSRFRIKSLFLFPDIAFYFLLSFIYSRK